MKKKLRIGKDFGLAWTIKAKNAEENAPYEPSSDSLLLLVTPYNKVQAEGAVFDGNTVRWIFRGKDQKHLGAYGLELVENRGKNGMVTIDTCEAFELVAHTCEETGYDGEDVIFDTLEFITDVELNALRGPQGEQGLVGPAGPSYDDTEVKNKLTELEEEMESNGVLIEDLQNMKIDKENDDYYPNMAVGLADNLAGVDVVDSEINFRRSGGGAISDGVARIESIKGNSLVWNQLAKKRTTTTSAAGLTAEWEGDYIRVTGTYTKEGDTNIYGSIESLQNVVQGQSFAVLSDNSKIGLFVFGVISGTLATSAIVKTNASGKMEITVRPVTALEAGTTVNEIIRPKITNLTKMFGVGNEPTTIEEFYARIPMGVDINAYNEGEVIHMDVQSLESQGVNAWDEEWERGTFNDAGEEVTTSLNDTIRCANSIEVLPNTDYYFAIPNTAGGSYMGFAFFYDNEGNFLIKNPIAGSAYPIVKTPSNAHTIRFDIRREYGVTYNHDICINLSDASINGKYFPYIKRVEDLSLIHKYFPDGMKSAGTAHDEIRYNKASGKWEKVVRIGVVDMGTLEVAVNNANEYIFTTLPANYKALNSLSATFPAICALFNSVSAIEADTQSLTNCIYGGNNWIIVRSSKHSDLASFKAAINGVILYYELAEPIVTELDAEDQLRDLDYQVWNAGTEKAIAEGKSAPLAADITYGFNAIGKIKELESLVAALRAKVGI